MTPSSRAAMSSTRVSSFFQSKSVPVSPGVASGFGSPRALAASAARIANERVLIVRVHSCLLVVTTVVRREPRVLVCSWHFDFQHFHAQIIQYHRRKN